MVGDRLISGVFKGVAAIAIVVFGPGIAQALSVTATFAGREAWEAAVRPAVPPTVTQSFASRTAWEAAIASGLIQTEDFAGVPPPVVSFTPGVPFDLGQFDIVLCCHSVGSQLIDVNRLRMVTVTGTPASIKFLFDVPITGFAADWTAIDDGNDLIIKPSGSTNSVNVTSIVNQTFPQGSGFAGFVTDEPFTVLEISSTFADALFVGNVSSAIWNLLEAPPTADAGADQAIRAGELVVLDGSASFDNNTPSTSLAYMWTFAGLPMGSTATLSDANTATPSFFADLPGSYVVALTVTDEVGLSSTPDQVVVSSDNIAPTANAGGNQLAVVGIGNSLDGSGSFDPENDPLQFSWTITSAPTGSLATLIGSDTVSPTFNPDLEGLYQVTLVVSDPIGPSLPDAIEITATNAATFAEISIVSASETVLELTADQITTVGNQTAFSSFFGQAVISIQMGKLEIAVNRLNDALSRTDGCVLRGAPDTAGLGRDWISDCAAQEMVYDLLHAALDVL